MCGGMRWKLEGSVVFCECQFNVVGAFVVNDVQLRCVSVLLQLFICTFPCITYRTTLSIWNSCCGDGVVAVKQKNVFVSTARWDGETAVSVRI